MKRLDLARLDRRMLLGGVLSGASLIVLAVGLIAVVSGLGGDPVHLPEEGSIEEILQDGETETIPGLATVIPINPLAPAGPKPTRLSVSRIYIDAPVGALGLEAESNIPAVPNRPDLVAWYDFTPTPNTNNNAVFAGHVDWQTDKGAPIAGVFYRLRELVIGDEIIVTLEDGAQVEYIVTGNVATKYDDPNVVRAMQRTSKDVITLITCGGSWVNDSSATGGNYSHRIIVRAEKKLVSVAASSS